MPEFKLQAIRDIVIFGDSLSGRGRMANRKLFGFLDMNNISGLEGKSYYGRFANSYVWSDQISKIFAAESNFPNPDLDDPYRVRTASGETLVRTLCEGGCTSADYSMKFNTLDISYLASREILTNLDELRAELIANDKIIETSEKDKAETLVLEWTGVNDLITVHSTPTKKSSEIAVQERLEHVKKMIALGYKNFVLLNLPDISITPRYKRLSSEERHEAHEVIKYFNDILKQGIEQINQVSADCNVTLYDICSEYQDIMNNPKSYGFDLEKLDATFVDSTDFKEGETNLVSEGYLFWNDVHPTSELHEIFANKLFTALKNKFKFFAPREPLMKIFRETYGNKVSKLNEAVSCDCSCLPMFSSYKEIEKKDVSSLDEIFSLAFKGHDKIIKEVLIDLQWINAVNQVVSKNPDICKAAQSYIAEKLKEDVKPAKVALS